MPSITTAEHPYFPDEDEARANAALIAVAPDLLEAAEALMNALRRLRDVCPACWDELLREARHDGASTNLFNAWDKTKAAISKAKEG